LGKEYIITGISVFVKVDRRISITGENLSVIDTNVVGTDPKLIVRDQTKRDIDGNFLTLAVFNKWLYWKIDCMKET